MEDNLNIEDFSNVFDSNGIANIINFINEHKTSLKQYSVLNIDFDNMFQINKIYSYLFGTALLEEGFAIVEKNVLGYGKVISKKSDRVLVYLENINEEQALVLGAGICREVSELYSGEQNQIQLTASIGVAMSSCNPREYDFLCVLKKSQLTLQFIKNTTKNRVVCYSYLVENAIVINEGLKIVEKETPDDIFIRKDENANLFYMDVLERTKDLKSAIKLLFMKISKYYGFEKIAVLQFNVERNYYTQLHIWDKKMTCDNCKDNYNKIQKFTKMEFTEYLQEIDKKGFIRMDSSKSDKLLNTTSSYLLKIQIPYYFQSEILGIVSYETNNIQLQLTDRDISNIKQFSKNIALHINGKYLDGTCKDKSIFLSRLTHDLRTPVNNIVGISGLIRETIDDKIEHSNQLIQYADKLDVLSKYIYNLVNEILDLSKMESGKFDLNYTYFNLEDLCNEIISMNLDNAKKEKVSLNYYFDKFNKKIYGDILRLHEVLMNLISNSIKYSKNNGKIILSTEVMNLQRSQKVVTIRFSVKDDGIGISEKNKEIIFAPFERAESESANHTPEGFGVGLYICRILVQLMGGELFVESEEGHGSVFFFDLNFEYMDNEEHLQKNITSLGYCFNGKRILLADDNDINILVEKHMLEKYGVLVDVATDGLETLEKYYASKEYYYDIILMDLRMPVMSGEEAIDKIRKSGRKDSKEIKILAISANIPTEINFDLGFIDGYLSKPIKIEDIVEALYSKTEFEIENNNEIKNKNDIQNSDEINNENDYEINNESDGEVNE